MPISYQPTTGTGGSAVWSTWWNNSTTSATTTTYYYQPTANTNLSLSGWTDMGYIDEVVAEPLVVRVREEPREEPRAAACMECGAGRAGPASHRLDCSQNLRYQERLEAERERAREQTERYARERRGRERREREAHERAETLLRLVLSPAELEHYDETGEIRITGSDGRTYRIRDGLVGNVAVLEDDEVVERLCAHPQEYFDDNGHIPMRDAHVGQILALRHDTAEFLSHANVHWRAPGRAIAA